MNNKNERNINRGIIHGDENKNEKQIENERAGECENKMENKNERNLNLDCPASSLGNRDVHDIDGKNNRNDLIEDFVVASDLFRTKNLRVNNEREYENKIKIFQKYSLIPISK